MANLSSTIKQDATRNVSENNNENNKDYTEMTAIGNNRFHQVQPLSTKGNELFDSNIDLRGVKKQSFLFLNDS